MKKPPRRPIYFVVVQAIDEKTGERFGALRPLNAVDQRAMRERKYAVGTEVRAELKKPRNVKFHRLAHALGALVVDQIDAFVGLTAHDALKRLQAESGAACDTMEYEIPGLGKVLRTEPRSLSFDEMDEATFQETVQTIYRHIQRTYWPSVDAEAIEQMVEMYEAN